jgi:hypothetical protein
MCPMICHEARDPKPEAVKGLSACHADLVPTMSPGRAFIICICRTRAERRTLGIGRSTLDRSSLGVWLLLLGYAWYRSLIQ